MNRWYYFFLGVQACLDSLVLLVLIFGEVTIGRMKQPISNHIILYPLVVILIVVFLVNAIWKMFR